MSGGDDAAHGKNDSGQKVTSHLVKPVIIGVLVGCTVINYFYVT